MRLRFRYIVSSLVANREIAGTENGLRAWAGSGAHAATRIPLAVQWAKSATSAQNSFSALGPLPSRMWENPSQLPQRGLWRLVEGHLIVEAAC